MSQFKPLPPIQELQQAFVYDPATGIFLHKYNRNNKTKAGDVAGHIDHKGYVRLVLDGCRMQAHRVAWYLMTGADPLPNQIDHIDRVRANNSWSNLRLATQAQNQHNAVSRGWTRYGNRYYAQIRIGGALISLGGYGTPEEAHEVYKAKHSEVHGSFSPYFQ
jgi:hypothetical protein